MKTSRIAFAGVLFALAVVTTAPTFAQDEPDASGNDPQPIPNSRVTRHQVRIGNQTVAYTATVGWLILEQDGKPWARFGYTAYTREGSDPARRPVMFAYNGGPGSSSIWLHMGILGPRRAVLTDADYTPPPAAALEDNGFSVLDVTDLVMVDPVGTGFSRPLGEATGADFWGVDQDIRSVGLFVKRYVTDNGRWPSPKFILGESYGGVRSAGLVHHMQSVHSMNFNGVVLVSPFLSVGSGIDGAEIDLPHVLYFPTLAATAWYHDAIANKPARLADYMSEVERFAYDEYAPALLAGYTIDPERKRAVARKLAAYTGTRPEYWEGADLRVTHGQFVQELMRGERKIAGRIDSRFVGPSLNPLAETMDYDPFFPAVGPALTAAFVDYLHRELEFGRDEEYAVFERNLDWDWKHVPPTTRAWNIPFANTVPDLAMALTMNPGLHLMVQQGWYDLATPTLATKHDLDHLDIAPEARQRIRLELYEAGHMMYLHEASRRKFREDLAGFVRGADGLD